MSDLSRLLEEARRRHPDLPVFLYGHSMGGNLVLNFALRRGGGIRGLIASAPFLRTARPVPRWKLTLGRVLARLWPTFQMSSGVRARDLARDPDVVRVYREDPLTHDRVTPGFLEVLRAGEWAIERAGDLAVPALLMHGDADPVTSVEASRVFAARAGGICTLEIWSEFGHEIHNEVERERVFALVLEWMQATLRQRRG